MLDNKSSVSVCQTANTQKYQHWDQADVLGFYASTGALLSTILQELDKAQVIKGFQNLDVGSRDPGHAHLGAVLWSLRREGPSSMSVPNFKRIAVYIRKNKGS